MMIFNLSKKRESDKRPEEQAVIINFDVMGSSEFFVEEVQSFASELEIH